MFFHCFGRSLSQKDRFPHQEVTPLQKGHYDLGLGGEALWGQPESMAEEQGDTHNSFRGYIGKISLLVPIPQGEEQEQAGFHHFPLFLTCPRKNSSLGLRGP